MHANTNALAHSPMISCNSYTTHSALFLPHLPLSISAQHQHVDTTAFAQRDPATPAQRDTHATQLRALSRRHDSISPCPHPTHPPPQQPPRHPPPNLRPLHPPRHALHHNRQNAPRPAPTHSLSLIIHRLPGISIHSTCKTISSEALSIRRKIETVDAMGQ